MPFDYLPQDTLNVTQKWHIREMEECCLMSSHKYVPSMKKVIPLWFKGFWCKTHSEVKRADKTSRMLEEIFFARFSVNWILCGFLWGFTFPPLSLRKARVRGGVGNVKPINKSITLKVFTPVFWLFFETQQHNIGFYFKSHFVLEVIRLPFAPLWRACNTLI